MTTNLAAAKQVSVDAVLVTYCCYMLFCQNKYNFVMTSNSSSFPPHQRFHDPYNCANRNTATVFYMVLYQRYSFCSSEIKP